MQRVCDQNVTWAPLASSQIRRSLSNKYLMMGQLELTLTDARKRTHGKSCPARQHRAKWWFAQMRQLVGEEETRGSYRPTANKEQNPHSED
jgi:hypothetical protein